MKVKNASGSSGVWAGQTINNGSYHTIATNIELLSWQNSGQVILDVANGKLIMNDEFSDLTDPSTGLQYLLGG